MQRRVYNGCPDSEFQRILDHQYDELEKARFKVLKLKPEAHCTLHLGRPEGYVVHVWGEPISKFCSSAIEAWNDALTNLKKGSKYEYVRKSK